jgi:hypothetical protein
MNIARLMNSQVVETLIDRLLVTQEKVKAEFWSIAEPDEETQKELTRYAMYQTITHWMDEVDFED